jgi:hypothetical protein
MGFSSFSRVRHRIAAEAGANPPSSLPASRFAAKPPESALD